MMEESMLTLPALSQISFANPWFLIALGIVPILIVWYIFKGRKARPELQISDFGGFQNQRKSAVVRLIHLPFILRMLGLSLLIVAIARPQTRLSWQDMTAEGIDIVMSMDLSPSMLARDLKPNRLEAAKEVAIDFTDGRPNDRIGLVIFSGEAYTQCPLTMICKQFAMIFVKNNPIAVDELFQPHSNLAISRITNHCSRPQARLSDGMRR
jgi:Ca-activated chloride channel family protein